MSKVLHRKRGDVRSRWCLLLITFVLKRFPPALSTSTHVVEYNLSLVARHHPRNRKGSSLYGFRHYGANYWQRIAIITAGHRSSQSRQAVLAVLRSSHSTPCIDASPAHLPGESLPPRAGRTCRRCHPRPPFHPLSPPPPLHPPSLPCQSRLYDPVLPRDATLSGGRGGDCSLKEKVIPYRKTMRQLIIKLGVQYRLGFWSFHKPPAPTSKTDKLICLHFD